LAPSDLPPIPSRRSSDLYVSVVSFTAAPPDRLNSFWTLPLPYDFSPITTARPWSCRAAATISLALALPLLTSTTIGRGSPGRGRSEEHTSELQSLRHLVC